MLSEPPNPERGTPQWYATLAERATEGALEEMRSGRDAGPELSLAMAANDILVGIAGKDVRAELDEFVFTDAGDIDVESRSTCACPPEMLARGGFRGRCPVHGIGRGARGPIAMLRQGT